MKKGWKIAAVGLIILLLFLIFFKECLWEWYDEVLHPWAPCRADWLCKVGQSINRYGLLY